MLGASPSTNSSTTGVCISTSSVQRRHYLYTSAGRRRIIYRALKKITTRPQKSQRFYVKNLKFFIKGLLSVPSRPAASYNGGSQGHGPSYADNEAAAALTSQARRQRHRRGSRRSPLRRFHDRPPAPRRPRARRPRRHGARASRPRPAALPLLPDAQGRGNVPQTLRHPRPDSPGRGRRPPCHGDRRPQRRPRSEEHTSE